MADYEKYWDGYVASAGIIFLATSSVYCGSYAALRLTPLKSKLQKAGVTEVEEEEPEDIPDRITRQEAWLFPLMGSVVLFSLYLIVKFFGTEWINWFLQWYFLLMGVLSVWRTSLSIAKKLIGARRWRGLHSYMIRINIGTESTGVLFQTGVKMPTAILLVLSSLPSILYAISTGRKSAFLTDVLALSFAHNALSVLKLDSFKTGVILVTGLFLYDIWWVFGTEVMLKVATTLDVPIKILWPKSLLFATDQGFAMLGLGDIVIPGAFVSLALRYDAWRWSESLQAASASRATQETTHNFPKPYFHTAMVFYVLGLSAATVAVHYFEAGQPALLYLTPACILSLLVPGCYLGDLQRAWTWTDEAEDSINKTR